MEVNPIFPPRVLHGQGKRTMTLLTEDGCIYPIIAHDAKNDRVVPRLNSAPVVRIRKGERPMHKTTFVIAKAPWQPDYTTTSRQFHGGSKLLEPVTQLPPSRSMHHNHFHFGSCNDGDLADASFRNTDYGQTYVPKDIIPANRLHLTSFFNRINQTEGHDVKDLVQPSTQPASYFTQYRRVHNKLGHLLGPGVEREHPVRQQYNVITGEAMGPAWQPHNPRMSGNRVLHSLRMELAPLLQ